MFPLELARRVIRLFTDEGDIVLDPFLGSGTTAIAAIETKRNFIGIEMMKKYAELAIANIEKAQSISQKNRPFKTLTLNFKDTSNTEKQ